MTKRSITTLCCQRLLQSRESNTSSASATSISRSGNAIIRRMNAEQRNGANKRFGGNFVAVPDEVGWKWSPSADDETDDTRWSRSMCNGSSHDERHDVSEDVRSSGSCTLWYDVHQWRGMQTLQLRVDRIKTLSTLPLQTETFRSLAELSALSRTRSAKRSLKVSVTTIRPAVNIGFVAFNCF